MQFQTVPPLKINDMKTQHHIRMSDKKDETGRPGRREESGVLTRVKP